MVFWKAISDRNKANAKQSESNFTGSRAGYRGINEEIVSVVIKLKLILFDS